MKCPCCLGGRRFIKTGNFVPEYLFPLRLLVECIYCDSCLQFFYRVRLAGWLIRSAGPNDAQWDDLLTTCQPLSPAVRRTQRTSSGRSNSRRLEHEGSLK